MLLLPSLMISVLVVQATASCYNSPLVEKFSTTFGEKLQDDPVASKILDLAKLFPSEAGKSFSEVVYKSFKTKLGADEAKKLANNVKKLNTDIFGPVTPSVFAQAYGVQVGSFLKASGALRNDNVESISSHLVQELKKDIKQVKGNKPTDLWEAKAIADLKIATSLGLNLNTDILTHVFKTFTNALSCLSKN